MPGTFWVLKREGEKCKKKVEKEYLNLSFKLANLKLEEGDSLSDTELK